MFESIAVCVASRERAGRFRDMYTSAKELAEDWGKVHFSLKLDIDDSQNVEYATFLRPDVDKITITPKPSNPSDFFNEAYLNVAHKYDIYGIISDDFIFQTQAWDTIVRNAFNRMPYTVGLVWGPDGTKNPPTYASLNYKSNPLQEWGSPALPTWLFLSQDIINLLGYCLPPAPPGDTWFLHIIAHLAQNGYEQQVSFVQDLLIKHFHWSFGLAQMDNTYAAAQKNFHARMDIFNMYYETRELDAKKIIAECERQKQRQT